jgi:hypothetical protein
MSTPGGQHHLDKIVAGNEPVMIIHRITGGFLYRSGDAQLGYDVDYPNISKLWLWRVISELTRDGNGVFRIESYTETEETLYMTYPVLNGGITWSKWLETDDQNVEQQRWYIVSAKEGGFAFVPCIATNYALGIINRVIAYACVRPNKLPYCGYIPLLNTWELVLCQGETHIPAH